VRGIVVLPGNKFAGDRTTLPSPLDNPGRHPAETLAVGLNQERFSVMSVISSEFANKRNWAASCAAGFDEIDNRARQPPSLNSSPRAAGDRDEMCGGIVGRRGIPRDVGETRGDAFSPVDLSAALAYAHHREPRTRSRPPPDAEFHPLRLTSAPAFFRNQSLP